MSSPVSETHQVEVQDDDAGARLDRMLAASLPRLSRTRLQKLIRDGNVALAGETVTDPSRTVKLGQTVTVTVPPPVSPVPKGEKIALDILFEDRHLVVLNKPAGLVVHPAPGNPDRTLVNALIAHCGDSLSGIGGVRRPGIVHRIDKETSGLMVIAKTDEAHKSLSGQFKDRSVERAYVALCRGWVPEQPGVIEGAIGRNPRNRKKMAVVERGGKHARTRYSVLKRFGKAATLVECRLDTGRTHQIRVHMAFFEHSLVGDPIYGRTGRASGKHNPLFETLNDFKRQALHARLIGFQHPKTGKMVHFESELPKDINDLLEQLASAED
jgi:23S rRNA pseudouridine1911/1915/1917 synthase